MSNTPHATPNATPLTDVQHEVLAAALRRADGAIALPARLKGKAAANLGQALLGKGLVREIRAKGDGPVWRRDADSGRSFSLVVTKAGRVLVGLRVEPAASASTPRRETPHTDAPVPAAPVGIVAASQAAIPRPGSKLAAVIALLRRRQGSSVTDLMAVTGWLPHTTRAALTGLRKRGYAVTREVAASGSVYRIAEASAAAA